jgi:hypothetical protein
MKSSMGEAEIGAATCTNSCQTEMLDDVDANDSPMYGRATMDH